MSLSAFLGLHISFPARAKKRNRSVARARICKRLMSSGIDSKESTPPAYVALQAGATNRIVVPTRLAGNQFQGYLKGLQIQAQYFSGKAEAILR